MGWGVEKVLVCQSCPTLCDPMDCSPPGSFVHGILQARMLEWVAMPFSRRLWRLGRGPKMTGTRSLQRGRSPSLTPGPTLSRLKGCLRPRPHNKMATDLGRSLLFPVVFSLVCYPT